MESKTVKMKIFSPSMINSREIIEGFQGTFFVNARGQRRFDRGIVTDLDTNMDVCGQLPYPLSFKVEAIRVYPGTPEDFDKWKTFWKKGTLTLWHGYTAFKLDLSDEIIHRPLPVPAHKHTKTTSEKFRHFVNQDKYPCLEAKKDLLISVVEAFHVYSETLEKGFQGLQMYVVLLGEMHHPVFSEDEP